MRSHSVTATELRVPHVAHGAPGVVSGGGLRERNVTTVAVELAALDGSGDVLLNADSTTGSVDEPRTLLHLADEVLVEEAVGALVKRSVDSDNVTLLDKVLDRLGTAGAELSLGGIIELVVVRVEKLLRAEGLQAAKDTLANAANTNGTDDLALNVVRVLSNLGNIPLARDVLVVRGNKVAHKVKDGHDNVLSDRLDVRASDLVDTDLTLIGLVEVDVVATDTSSNTVLQVLGLVDTLGGDVAGVERSSDDNVGINEFLFEGRVGTLLVRGGDKGVALALNPLTETKLILDSTKETGLALGSLTTLVEDGDNLVLADCRGAEGTSLDSAAENGRLNEAGEHCCSVGDDCRGVGSFYAGTKSDDGPRGISCTLRWTATSVRVQLHFHFMS